MPDGKEIELWFEVDSQYKDMIAHEVCDAFFILVIPFAFQYKLGIKVDGKLSAKLLYNVRNYFVHAFGTFIESDHKVKIIAPYTTSEKWQGKGVTTGFSAGIDSFCTYIDHSLKSEQEEYQITHFIFNDVGAHQENFKNKNEVLGKHLERMKEFSYQVGIPLVFVKSNISEVMPLSFLSTHTIRNAACALLLQKEFCKFLYSSGLTYLDVKLKGAEDIAYIDPLIVHLLSTESIECISAGVQYSRYQKTKIVSENLYSYKFLDVCVRHDNHGVNCSRCSKCMRTQLGLDVMGKLDKYNEVFDNKIFQEFKFIYLLMILKDRGDPFQKELQRQFIVNNYHVPYSAKIISLIIPTKVLEIFYYRSIELLSVKIFSVVGYSIHNAISKRMRNTHF